MRACVPRHACVCLRGAYARTYVIVCACARVGECVRICERAYVVVRSCLCAYIMYIRPIQYVGFIISLTKCCPRNLIV